MVARGLRSTACRRPDHGRLSALSGSTMNSADHVRSILTVVRDPASVVSRLAGLARPGRARLVQLERPTGRTSWTRRARSGCLWCQMVRRVSACPPGGPGPGLEVLAAGGTIRVQGRRSWPPEAPDAPRPLTWKWLTSASEGSRPTFEARSPVVWTRQVRFGSRAKAPSPLRRGVRCCPKSCRRCSPFSPDRSCGSSSCVGRAGKTFRRLPLPSPGIATSW